MLLIFHIVIFKNYLYFKNFTVSFQYHFFAHFYTLHLCLKSQIEFQMSVDKLQITSVDRENSVTHCKQIIEQISYFFDGTGQPDRNYDDHPDIWTAEVLEVIRPSG